MKNLKKNQIIIFVIALMLVSAGYLNYTATNKENTIQTSSKLNSIDYAGIGDARLVSSNAIESNTIESIVSNDEKESYTVSGISTNEETKKDEEKVNETKENENTKATNEEKSNTVTTNSKTTDEYFSSSKLTRDTMYSQMLETYEKILQNENIAADQKMIAQTEVKNINDNKNKIMICENLIKTKEIEDCVIFINGESISVVIKSNTLEQNQIAQIQNIISREMQVEANNIHISNR